MHRSFLELQNDEMEVDFSLVLLADWNDLGQKTNFTA